MDRIVPAAEASRRFLQLLQAVREGYSYVVTAHGRPVARIIPINDEEAVKDKARGLLLARLRSQPAIDVGRWTSEELYEEPL